MHSKKADGVDQASSTASDATSSSNHRRPVPSVVIRKSIAENAFEEESDSSSAASDSEDGDEQQSESPDIAAPTSSLMSRMFGPVSDSNDAHLPKKLTREKRNKEISLAELDEVTRGLEEENDRKVSPSPEANEPQLEKASHSEFSVSKKTPTRRGAILGRFLGYGTESSPVSPVAEKISISPKSEKESEQERKRKRAEEAEEAQRIQQARLEKEPLMAKDLRKIFADASHVVVLLTEVFTGSRFGEINTIKSATKQIYTEWLAAEISQDAVNQISINKFVTWKQEADKLNIPFQVTADFDFSLWEKKLGGLSELWHEVFRHYAIASEGRYPFSLQPLEKLRYFFEELNALSNLESQFDKYMKKVLANDSIAFLERQKSSIEKFITTIKLFVARTIELYVILRGIKDAMESNQKIQGKLSRSYFSEEITLTVHERDSDEEDYDENENIEELQWKQRLAAAIAAVKSKTNAIAGYEAQIEHTCDKKEIAVIRSKLHSAKKELKPILTELKAAEAEAEMAMETRDKNKAAAIKRKQKDRVAKELDVQEEKSRRLSVARVTKQVFAEAYDPAIKFLTDYAAQPEAQALLTITSPIQCPLATVSADMLQIWLSDQNEEISEEDGQCLAAFIAPKVRELTLSLTVTLEAGSNSNSTSLSEISPEVEIRLEDSHREMLEVLVINVNGPARGTLIPPTKQSVAERASTTYLENLKKAGQNIVPGAKSGSDTSIRAAQLLGKIRAGMREYYDKQGLQYNATVKTKQFNQVTFALFGLYVLLYLQDAPGHNFNTKLSANTPGGGSRFLRELMPLVQQEFGYHLRACKLIYDAMSKRKILSAKAPATRSPLLTQKASAASKLSADLKYLFDPTRSVRELSSTVIKITLLPTDNEAHETLVSELTGRYIATLKDLVTVQKINEVQRKLLKRIVEAMEQVPYNKRQALMNSQIIQLIILRKQIEFYHREVKGSKSSATGTVMAKVSRVALIQSGVDRKQDKLAFFQATFDYLKVKYMPDADKNLALTKSDGILPFIVEVYETIEGKLLTDGVNNIAEWVREKLLQGEDTLTALMWLPNTVLDEIFVGSGLGAATIREKKGASEAAFNMLVSDNNIDEAAASNMIIVNANELFIVLACQAAVLEFSALMLETENKNIIMSASQHSWFLQLRFWDVFLTEKNIFPANNQQASQPTRAKEKGMLKVFDNLMKDISQLAGWADEFFAHARLADITENLSVKSEPEKIKLVFVLVAEFFSVLFSAWGAAAAAKNLSADVRFFQGLSKYFDDIKKMAGCTLNKEYDGILFALAVRFLLAHSSLLGSARIEICSIKNRDVLERERSVSVISNNADSSLDTYIYSSNALVTIDQGSTKKALEILSDKKVAFFVETVQLADPQESIALRDVLSRAGAYGSGKKA